MGCTPLFLNAEPHSTGLTLLAIVARRMAALISSTESSSPSRYFSMIVVVDVGQRLDAASRATRAAASARSAGISSIA